MRRYLLEVRELGDDGQRYTWGAKIEAANVDSAAAKAVAKNRLARRSHRIKRMTLTIQEESHRDY